MKLQEAFEKYDEYSNILNEAEQERENGHDGASDRLITEAHKVEKEIERGGYTILQLMGLSRPNPHSA